VHAIVWVAIVLAVVIVSCAIGIPYWMTHRRMAEHYDHTPGEAYLEGTGRTRQDADAARPSGHVWRRRPASGRRSASAKREGLSRTDS
jgi:hypothetical protein